MKIDTDDSSFWSTRWNQQVALAQMLEPPFIDLDLMMLYQPVRPLISNVCDDGIAYYIYK